MTGQQPGQPIGARSLEEVTAEALEAEGFVWRQVPIETAAQHAGPAGKAAEDALNRVRALDLRCWAYYDCYVPGKPLRDGVKMCPPCEVRHAIDGPEA